jgi:cob(I)alamin adenosyltransferase
VGYRLSKITTRTGDQGTTGLATGTRVAKDSARILAVGAVDELNSWIGLVLAQPAPDEVRAALSEVQHALFEVGAELSLPGTSRITEEDVLGLEALVERFNARLEPLREFVLPGGSEPAAMCHVARTVCRRAETQIVGLHAAEAPGESLLVPYLNRLSDLLFVLARILNKASGTPEPLWRNTRRGGSKR